MKALQFLCPFDQCNPEHSKRLIFGGLFGHINFIKHLAQIHAEYLHNAEHIQ